MIFIVVLSLVSAGVVIKMISLQMEINRQRDRSAELSQHQIKLEMQQFRLLDLLERTLQEDNEPPDQPQEQREE